MSDIVCYLTDFSNATKWKQLKQKTQEGEFPCPITFIEDKQYEHSSVTNLINIQNEEEYITVADKRTLEDETFVVVDVSTKESFRCSVLHLWSPLCNLSISNMSFEEFLESVDKDGVFIPF
ncbi:hypothetical protein K7432_012355 [Basidiobolus ranarum]|uniref:DUF6924 domain-containing protein n=1 Tax=Basidiobolus ranarum TaxID=34480 RepID=A0ABR2VSD2_9FUNG